VLIMKTKTGKATPVQLEYIIHIQQIKPWPPSQSLRSIRNVLILWDHGDKISGSTAQVVPSLGTGSGIGDGRIEFNESFKLQVTLTRDMTIKGSRSGEHFLKNYIEFNLYEPRREKALLLGNAVLDLAEYGKVRQNLSITVPINCKRTYRNTVQPLLFIMIQPTRRSMSSLSKNSMVTEEYGDEAEVNSFTTDDDVSSHSSLAVGSSAVGSNDSSSPQNRNVSCYDHLLFLSSCVVVLLNLNELNFTLFISQNETARSNSSDKRLKDIHVSNKLDTQSNEAQIAESDMHSRAFSSHSQRIAFLSTDSSTMEEIGKQHNVVQSNLVSSGKDEKVQSIPNEILSNGRCSVNTEHKDSKSFDKEKDRRIHHLMRRLQMLEAELQGSAVLEASVYSVVAEHGSSMNKVHAPARRLLRFYLHAGKLNTESTRASAARSVVSGLVLVAKACASDVPRLTFWLSNCIVLRVIVSMSTVDSKFPDDFLVQMEKKQSESFPRKNAAAGHRIVDDMYDWSTTSTFAAALEKVETWIFSRIIESLWWQTFTPHMQSGAAREIHTSMDSETSRSFSMKSKSTQLQQLNSSVELWKRAFKDAFRRICPIRAEGHDCGCLPVLSKLIMEQLISRLDVAMFNAILRESSDEMPTDPVADPISDPKVLPIPAGEASFGAGAQLKTAIGSWSRWLTDLFGIDDDDDEIPRNAAADDDDSDVASSLKSFYLLNSLSDLMMLPKDMLLSQTVRKEVCPAFGPPLIRRILNSFVPDEFCPDPIPGVVIEALHSEEDYFNVEEDEISQLPCGATGIVYRPPSTSAVEGSCFATVVKKSQTSEDELDELTSPLNSIVGSQHHHHHQNRGVRHRLLREVWMN
ncbi:hypothetical protein M569_07484, partial [Genlisea aurea]